MSKIGKKNISIPEQVTVTVTNDYVLVKGPKGELKTPMVEGIKVKVENQEVIVERKNDLKQSRANHGLMRSLIANNVIGVTEAYRKTLKLVGTGYRVSSAGAGLSMTLGFSHPVTVAAIPGITFKLEGNDTIHVEGIDKQLVGQVSANIRSLRPPEPYLGKGIRYSDEVVRTKPGKTVS
ncbi:50S ribosomal protein L6 [Candidatus Woesebacteria bacterium]|jgi:large subunit ribosomal protein L6|nr:50S ribosomal protein L6 [Candidatus Woesebacteria bacterium]HOC07326.1 50S ribosomal protein L6 [Candidatus Woesebacteria bacterium]HOP38825.1 50S ribosomal protein L6 [Candidatus Woesebacteria bacterium]HQL11249.1 50S ribosomal protein L6 [Candidatus Woesebacteria bacterium]